MLIILILVTGCSSIEKIDIKESGLLINEKTSLISVAPSSEAMLSISLVNGIIEQKQLLLPKGTHLLRVYYRVGNSSASQKMKINFDGIKDYEVHAQVEQNKASRDIVKFWVTDKETSKTVPMVR